MLETLCLEAVREDPALACVEAYVDCLEHLAIAPHPADKARAQTFLASRPRAGLLVGEAAQAGYWPFGAGAFESLSTFLRSLTGRI